MLFYPLIDLLTPALPSDLNQELASLGRLLYSSEMIRFQYCRTATIPVWQHSSIVLLALDSYFVTVFTDNCFYMVVSDPTGILHLFV